MKISTLLAAIVVAMAVAVFFTPPPAGLSVTTMHAAGLVVLAIGLWAFHLLPEHITGLIFMVLAMLLKIAPPQVIFSGFASGTLWLVLRRTGHRGSGALTGLGERIAPGCSLSATPRPILLR